MTTPVSAAAGDSRFHPSRRQLDRAGRCTNLAPRANICRNVGRHGPNANGEQKNIHRSQTRTVGIHARLPYSPSTMARMHIVVSRRQTAPRSHTDRPSAAGRTRPDRSVTTTQEHAPTTKAVRLCWNLRCGRPGISVARFASPFTPTQQIQRHLNHIAHHVAWIRSLGSAVFRISGPQTP